jgi:hypothetical protein
VIEMIQKADAVAFDVDSTVCTDEGIDELAAFLGKGAEAGPPRCTLTPPSSTAQWRLVPIVVSTLEPIK